jgi:hypothetical protein
MAFSGMMPQMKVTVRGVVAQEISKWWPFVAHWIDAALAHGGDMYSKDDILEAIKCRDMQMWIIHCDDELKAVCVTGIRQWPQAKVLTAIIVAGNDMPHWVFALDDTLTRYALEHGCKALEAHGRKGWKPTLGALGWRDVAVTYTKEIDHV